MVLILPTFQCEIKTLRSYQPLRCADILHDYQTDVESKSIAINYNDKLCLRWIDDNGQRCFLSQW